MKLRPFQPCDAPAVVGWLRDEYTFHLWSAGKYATYPLTAKVFCLKNSENALDPHFLALTAVEGENEVVGYLSMRRLPACENEIRFATIVVSDEKRGMGLGKKLITAAAKYAFDILLVEKISIAVFSQNERAISCYRSVGFCFDENASPKEYACMGEKWLARLMILERNSFSGE